MVARTELVALSVALRRKLLLLNADIRLERRKKHPDTAALFSLCQTRKALNQALVQCEGTLNAWPASEHEALYARLLALYKSA